MTDMTAALPADTPRACSLLARTNAPAAATPPNARFELYGMPRSPSACWRWRSAGLDPVERGFRPFQADLHPAPVTLDAAVLDKSGQPQPRRDASKVTTFGYAPLIEALLTRCAARASRAGPDRQGRGEPDLEGGARRPARRGSGDPSLIGQTIDFEPGHGRIDGYLKGRVTMESAVRDSPTSRPNSCNSPTPQLGLHHRPDASDQRPEAAGLGIAHHRLGLHDAHGAGLSPCPSASRPRSTSRNSRPRTAGPT
jgi:phosphate transport system permease protein